MHNRGGITDFTVYGAAFDENLNVVHRRITDENDFHFLQGSKYVQSILGNCFQLVRDDLNNGRLVVFSGTPCQVYSLKTFLHNQGVDSSKLVTVDIICHGTPSPKLWNDFKFFLEQKVGASVVNFNFRYQKAKWKEYPVRAEFSNGKVMINSHLVRLYTILFMSGRIMRPCCYNCKFANIERVSDLTIGDFWGIDECIPEFPFNRDVSEIIVNTQNGHQIIDAIKEMADHDQNIFIKKYVGDRFIQYQHNLRTPTCRPVDTDAFWEDYQKNGFEYAVKKYADYSSKGKIKHFIKKMMAELGLRN